ncbi:MAG TPA: tRNA lysidine(34) synthetase TilS C-terminal domain-containing protein, partial [Xanthomonadales bacterium]|nr:tRNA lysidine(34) synthetase TilS C-terminal domain-containing protein [Xanthomonadales bacterium]
ERLLIGALAGSRSALTSADKLHSSDKGKLKEIMRLSGTPTWLRDSVPVLVMHGELSAIGDWWLSPRLKACLDANRQRYSWQVENPLLKHVQSVCHNWTVDPGNTLV